MKLSKLWKEVKTNDVVLSLGCNLGDRIKTLNLAVSCLSDSGVMNNCKVSSYYETEPYGVRNQAWFINIVLRGESDFCPEQLLYLCKSLEYLLGRKPRARWHEREIDIDLLLVNGKSMQTDKLTLPHKLMHARNFVMYPLAEIAPNLHHPVFGKTMAELKIECEDDCEIRKL